MEKDNHTQAFPVAGLANLPNDNWINPEPGMSLRDYFAAKAMQTVLSQDCWNYQIAVVQAYKVADHMMHVRKL